MGRRARSDQDQITRTKLDAKERDALRRQLHSALELMLPDLSDSKVHEVLAGYAAADGPPIARVPPASTAHDSASEHPASESDQPESGHAAANGDNSTLVGPMRVGENGRSD